jgi:hypothetical protein
VYALSITIFSLLLFSSVGSLISSRWAARPQGALRRLGLLLPPLVIAYAIFLPRAFASTLSLDFPLRVVIAILAQMPLGLLLGMFLPLGIACVSRENPRLVPWAWGINGVGSVLGTTLSVLLAMQWGFVVVACIAATLYAGGVALLLGRQRTRFA